MQRGSELLGRYQHYIETCFADDNPKGARGPSRSFSVRHEGRNVRAAGGAQAEQQKAREVRSREDVQRKELKEREACKLTNPYTDYDEGRRVGVQELSERITLDLQGMKALKRYVDLLDRMDDKGRLIQGDEKLYKFCKEVRESALSIFQNYLRADKSARIAQNGVLYLLERLNSSNSR